MTELLYEISHDKLTKCAFRMFRFVYRVSSAQAKAEEADVAAREATRHEESARYQASQTNQLNPQPGNYILPFIA